MNTDFVDWFMCIYLHINTGKTKVLLVDFCRHKHPPLHPLNIKGDWVTDVVETYIYLGGHLNNKLD